MTLMQLRDAEASDISFIYDSFMKSYKADGPLGKITTKRVFFQEFPQVIDRILSTSKVQIMCLSEEPKIIVGYIIFQPQLIHYIFVKEPFRRNGIAKTLKSHALGLNDSFTYTHITHHVKKLLTKYPDALFNPFKLYQKGEING